MINQVRATLAQKRDYEAEYLYLRNIADDQRRKMTEKQLERLQYLEHALQCIDSWITLLSEDEAYIIKRHYFDGIDLPRITTEFCDRWGVEHGRDERTLKRYQSRALRKIVQFEMAKDRLLIS